MDSATFEQFRTLIYRESGIVFKDDKVALLENRIQKRMRDLKLGSPRAYFQIVETDLSGAELTTLLDSVSTNVTFFYREPSHFDTLRNVVTSWKEQGLSSLRVWCAAASSGEEPYTIAFTILDTIDPGKVAFKLLGTDISTRVLQKADQGMYSTQEIEKVPGAVRTKYLVPLPNGQYRVHERARQHVLFRTMNLTKHPYPIKGQVDIIFCRNVMIYFDKETRQGILTDFARLVRPGGYLFLSHSEGLLGIDHPFETLGSSVFRMPTLPNRGEGRR